MMMTDNPGEKIHGTCIEVEGLGVLLRGPAGSGKSDLALRLIDDGARLVADDYTELSHEKGKLRARAPNTIEGLIEVRGVGVLKIGGALQAELGAVIDLVSNDQVERLPEDESVEILGMSIPYFRLAPFEASTPAKVRLIVRRVKGDIMHVP
jgi:HPr kinase/phosphorylase